MWEGRMKFVIAAVCGLSLWVVSTANAGFTTINTPRPSEANFATILGDVYGGTFTPNGVNFSNAAGVTATRIDDDNDQVFDTGGSLTARAVAIYSRMPQNFGVWDGAGPGGSYNKLFDATPLPGGGASGSVTDVPVTAQLRFGRGGNTAVYSSNIADGTDTLGRDHQVVWTISGNGIKPGTMLIGWEDDDRLGTLSDFDFQDLVVEVVTGAPIPLPTAAIPGLLTLVGVAIITKVRKLRRQIA